MRLSLNVKLNALVATFVALPVLLVVVTSSLLNQKKADGLQINLTGRQRMLSQRMAKEAVLLHQSKSNNERAKWREALKQTTSLFDKTLLALTDGGETLNGKMESCILPAAEDPDVKTALAKGKDLWVEVKKRTDTMVAIDENQDQEKRTQALGFLVANNVNLLKLMNTATGAFQKASDDKLGTLYTAQNMAVILVIGLGIIGFFVGRSITKPLAMAIKKLSDGSESIASASNEIAQAAQDVAEGVQTNAASLVETTATIDEVASSAQANAERAEEVAELACCTQDMVRQGDKTMTSMQAAMGKIEDSTTNVANVLKAIEDIAFQTNLLALNAAIEAEGAEEHGKRFAVVAEEVRNLAERSGKAAGETAESIRMALSSAKDGSSHCGSTVAMLKDITTSVTSVNSKIADINAMSKSQATAIGEINIALGRIDAVVQSNAAVSEQSAASAHMLGEQADDLERVVVDLRDLLEGGATKKGPGQTRERRSSRQPSKRKNGSSFTIDHDTDEDDMPIDEMF